MGLEAILFPSRAGASATRCAGVKLAEVLEKVMKAELIRLGLTLIKPAISVFSPRSYARENLIWWQLSNPH